MIEPEIVAAVCTLQYEKRCVDHLMQLAAYPKIIKGWCIPDTCLIVQSRNAAIQVAYEKHPDFTHILFIDDDMTDFTIHHVARLVQLDRSIISPLVTNRKAPYRLLGRVKENDEQLRQCISRRQVVKSDGVAMAFTLIKREVLDAIHEETDDGPVWFTMDRSPRKDYAEEKKEFLRQARSEFNIINSTDPEVLENSFRTLLEQAFLMGENAHKGSAFIGEDYAFCETAKELGFQSWIDCGSTVGHLGQHSVQYQMVFKQRARELAAEQEKLRIVS